MLMFAAVSSQVQCSENKKPELHSDSTGLSMLNLHTEHSWFGSVPSRTSQLSEKNMSTWLRHAMLHLNKQQVEMFAYNAV